MGAIWLGSLPEVLRLAGVPVQTYPGWETRSRSSGGYDALMGIQVHHTASSGSNPANEMAWMWQNASTKPIGAIYLAPDGTWTVGAAGATNTSGRGGPLVTSRGVIPLDAANRMVLAIEAANRGDGTPWPVAQQLSYVKGVAALNKAYFGGVLREVGDVHAHFEWTSRKIDPAGQSKYAVGAAKWNMHQFRTDVAFTNAQPPAPPTDPDEEEEMAYLAVPPAERFGKPWIYVSSACRPATSFDIEDKVPQRKMDSIKGSMPDGTPYRVLQYDQLHEAAGLGPV